MAYEKEKQIAIAAVTQAATLCEQVRHNRSPEAIEKTDRSPVTIADFGSQVLICRAIAEAFPNDPIVAEEDSTLIRQPEMAEPLQQLTTVVRSILATDVTETQIVNWLDRGKGQVSSRFWTLDPIDGTKGFLRGDHYAIALALIEAGEVKVGVMACPALAIDSEPGVIFVAVQGQGTEVISLQTGKGQSVQVNQTDSATFRLIESVEAEHGNFELQRSVAQTAGFTLPSIQMDSQAKYGMVASGQAALYLRLPWSLRPGYQENIWDHAAGAIVVTEAGGRVTDMEGKPLDFSQNAKLIHNRGIVATNGTFHDAVLSALRRN